MQFLTSLIGGSGNSLINAVLALGAVLILILLALWALKLVMSASNNVVRGGARKRLAVVDTLQVDGKRQLVIIRRDNIEHLILTGGPQDVVVETGIPLEVQQAGPRPIPTARGPQRQPAPPPSQPAAAPQPQRAPVAQRAPVPDTVLPMPSNDAAPLRSPLDRLRELGRTPPARRPGSLRHTGLMRPVSRMEPGMIPPNADNSVSTDEDSATTGRVMPFSVPREGGQGFGDGKRDEHRDEGY